MKLKIHRSLLLLFLSSPFYAQVGIGTTSPNASSILDITSTNAGLLIPRVALTGANDITTIAAPVTSLLVYNSGFAPNGYYYWNGTIWVQLAASTTAWTLTGNAGTAVATNFLGTTDNVDLVIKRNNIRAGYIGDPYYDPTSFNSNNGNTSLGANSLTNPTINIATQTGVRNTAVGVNVMPGLTTGQRNTGVGDFALFSNTTGTENTAVGVGSLYSNIFSSGHVAIGRNALTSFNAPNTANIGNTAVGFSSLRNSVTGNSNTAIGFESLRNVLGSGNVGIGYQAGRLEIGSNKLYVENSNADANNALIYGEFDTNIVRVNGTLQISNPTTPNGYAFPVVRGTAGQVLQTNGAGATSWASNTALAYDTTGAATGIYNVALTQYTVRVFGGVSEVSLPTPVGNLGKIFIIIGSNGITAKIFSTPAGNIYDDVTNTFITTISGSIRYTVQSDGTDWIVIGR